MSVSTCKLTQPKGCVYEISLVPSKTLDTHLSPSDFVDAVLRRWGVDVMDSSRPCCCCGEHLDAQGSHCFSCMDGEDATTQHNAVLDVYFDFCERAGLRPISEAPNTLQDIFTRDGRCRLASVCPSSGSCPCSVHWSQSDSHGANLSGHSVHQCAGPRPLATYTYPIRVYCRQLQCC